jgi:hypothetical protein
LNDGRTEYSWDCDRHILEPDTWHHVAVIVDGGPKVITFVVDGVLCDGGETRQFGWGRFICSKTPPPRDLRVSRIDCSFSEICGSESLKVAPALNGQVKVLRIYSQYLRTSEAVGNFKAGC